MIVTNKIQLLRQCDCDICALNMALKLHLIVLASSRKHCTHSLINSDIISCSSTISICISITYVCASCIVVRDCCPLAHNNKIDSTRCNCVVMVLLLLRAIPLILQQLPFAILFFVVGQRMGLFSRKKSFLFFCDCCFFSGYYYHYCHYRYHQRKFLPPIHACDNNFINWYFHAIGNGMCHVLGHWNQTTMPMTMTIRTTKITITTTKRKKKSWD